MQDAEWLAAADLAAELATMPMREGGCGLTSAAFVAEAAYIGGWAGTAWFLQRSLGDVPASGVQGGGSEWRPRTAALPSRIRLAWGVSVCAGAVHSQRRRGAVAGIAGSHAVQQCQRPAPCQLRHPARHLARVGGWGTAQIQAACLHRRSRPPLSLEPHPLPLPLPAL